VVESRPKGEGFDLGFTPPSRRGFTFVICFWNFRCPFVHFCVILTMNIVFKYGNITIFENK